MRFNPLKSGQGFTLLEVMIVILIMAVAAATIRIAATSSDPLEDISSTAFTFQNWFSSQQDKALFSSTDIGLYFMTSKVAVLSWREGNPEEGEEETIWEVENEIDFASGLDELRTELQLDIEAAQWVELEDVLPDDVEYIQPHIILLPSEEYFPSFQLTFTHEDYDDEAIYVAGDGFNRLEVTRAAR